MDVQNKLLQEIQDVKESLREDPLTFEVINRINYLDHVVSESLRKWPPAPAPGTDRLCTKDITFENPDGSEVAGNYTTTKELFFKPG
uniref:Cytochrome P450 n=1 Tax=Megaselia scalaris TaxID=36166 RepID=T1GV60_MEGSC